MKKLIPVLLSLVLILSFPVSAASGKLTAGAVSGKVGDRVTVTLHLDNPGIVATRIFVRYDPQTLRLEGAQNGDVFDAQYAEFGKDLSADPYTLVWMDALRKDNNTKSGTLCTLQFTVLKAPDSGESSIRFAVDKNSTFDVDLNEATLADTSCAVRIAGGTEKTSAPQAAADTTAKPTATHGNTGATTTGTSTQKPSVTVTQTTGAAPVTASSGKPASTAAGTSASAISGTPTTASSGETAAVSAAATVPAGETGDAAATQTVPEKAPDDADATANGDATDVLFAAEQTDESASIEAQNVTEADIATAPTTSKGVLRWIWLPALAVIALAVVLAARKKKNADAV